MTLKVIIFTDHNNFEGRQHLWHGISKRAHITNDISSYALKGSGAYKISNILEDLGYPTRVIPHFNYYLENYLKDILNLIDTHKKSLEYVMFSTTFMLFKDKYKHHYKVLWEIFRKHNIKVVLGGAARNTDYILDKYGFEYQRILGYAEPGIVKFLETKSTNKIFAYDTKALTYDFANSGITFRKGTVITPNETLPFELSRGCRFACKFCSFSLIGRKPTDDYIKHPDLIYKEFMHNFENFGTTNYIFSCDTFNESNEKLEMILNVTQRLPFKIRFATYLRVDLLYRFPEQIEMLKEIGIRGATFGIETLNHESGKAIGKGLHPDKTIETLHKCKEIWGKNTILHGTCIIGLPHDTFKTVNEWTDKITSGKAGLDSCLFRQLGIDPQFLDGKDNSSFFDQNPEKYGYVFDKNWKWTNHNNGWTHEKAKHVAQIINNYKRDKLSISSWHYIEALGYGFKEDDMTNLRRGNTEAYNDFMQKRIDLNIEKMDNEAPLHFS